MSEADGIVRLRQPIGVEYSWSAGPNATSHLSGLMNGKLIGKRCPSCTLVYFPPRNNTPTKDWPSSYLQAFFRQQGLPDGLDIR